MRNFNFSSRAGSPFIAEKLKFHTIRGPSPQIRFQNILCPENYKFSSN